LRALSCYISDNYLQQFIRNFRQFYRGKPISNQSTEPVIELAVNETTTGFIQTLLNFFDLKTPPGEDGSGRAVSGVFLFTAHQSRKPRVGGLPHQPDRPAPHVALRSAGGQLHVQPMSLNDYAQIANCSLATFKREFKKLFNVPPAQWLIQKRLDYALMLLNTTERSIGDIFFDSGFENGSHFSRVFKDRFGLSPLHYRQAEEITDVLTVSALS
jgi:AraC-like DNA-binding protein